MLILIFKYVKKLLFHYSPLVTIEKSFPVVYDNLKRILFLFLNFWAYSIKMFN